MAKTNDAPDAARDTRCRRTSFCSPSGPDIRPAACSVAIPT